MSKKRILHIIQSLESGGCENMLLRTLPLLNNFEHKIITLKKLGELTPKFVSAGIAVETIHCNGLFDIPGIFRLRKLVREENPDIILTYLFHADMIGRLFLRPIPSVFARSLQRSNPKIKLVPIIPFLRTTYNHPKYLIARILEWLTKPLVSQYLANSKAVKDFYVRHIGVRPEKITIIPNGIDTGYFDSVSYDPELRKSLNINQDDFIIICVANLHINKGHKYLLEAFEDIFQTKKNLKLLLVGDGTERGNLEQQIRSYHSKENILFLGKRNDVPKLLKISDLFVLPTLFEGQSNAILEAMAAGLPVITTDISENRILIQNGTDGLLVREKSPSALAKQIAYLRDNNAIKSALAEKSREKIERDFSLAQSVKKWENSLMRILS